MTKYDKLLAAKETGEEWLLRIPGVHSVGIGLKKVHGKRTRDMAIAVFLDKMKHLFGLIVKECGTRLGDLSSSVAPVRVPCGRLRAMRPAHLPFPQVEKLRKFT